MQARRHCEEAQPTWQSPDRFAALAMTGKLLVTTMLMLFFGAASAQEGDIDLVGHTKLRLVGQGFDESSLFHDIAGSSSLDAAAELRLNLSFAREGWALQADYQLVAAHSEFLPAGLPTDEQRLFDLTHTLHDGGEEAALHRLDRFWVGYTGTRTVVRMGRQALSWGNGLFFTPMDLVNPFDPTVIDTEYKTGDDMLYAQYLRDNGDDLQAAVVFRRDPSTGDADQDAGTAALKYHGFAGETEYDLLLAEDRGDTVIGVGGVRSVGGAVVRADLVVTDAPGETITEFVANLSYSWVWAEKNVSASAEYYYDDENSYVAGSLMIEMSPLWLLTPTVIANADDPSALLQLVTRYSLSDNMSFLGSLNIPVGAEGTEYGGPESGLPGRFLSFEYGVFAQLAWYF
jgi:hypothetical protein